MSGAWTFLSVSLILDRKNVKRNATPHHGIRDMKHYLVPDLNASRTYVCGVRRTGPRVVCSPGSERQQGACQCFEATINHRKRTLKPKMQCLKGITPALKRKYLTLAFKTAAHCAGPTVPPSDRNYKPKLQRMSVQNEEYAQKASMPRGETTATRSDG